MSKARSSVYNCDHSELPWAGPADGDTEEVEGLEADDLSTDAGEVGAALCE